MAAAYVEVYERADGLFEWRLIASNGEIVCATTQGFTTRHDATRAVTRARLLMQDAEVEDL